MKSFRVGAKDTVAASVTPTTRCAFERPPAGKEFEDPRCCRCALVHSSVRAPGRVFTTGIVAGPISQHPTLDDGDEAADRILEGFARYPVSAIVGEPA